jgi:isopentenyl phosphate kinase
MQKLKRKLITNKINTKANHKVVPSSFLDVDREIEERYLRHVSDFLKRGTLPASYQRRRGKGTSDII